MQAAHDVLNGLDLNLLRALDALLAERHVTRAATRLGITQSAASHALARLRDALGDPLLVRGPRGAMVPTARAEALAAPLGQALAALAAAIRGGARFDAATARRTFRVATGDYAELVLLPPLVARLARAAPGIDLWVHVGGDDVVAALVDGGLDCTIQPQRGRDWPAGCFARPLFTETFTCIVRAGHPAAGQRLTLARYCALPHLLVAPRGTPGSIVDDVLAAAGRSRRVAAAVPHFLVVPHVIAATDLVATLPTRVVDAIEPLVDVVRMPPPLELPTFAMALVWHERVHHDPAQRWLRDQLFAVAGALA